MKRLILWSIVVGVLCPVAAQAQTDPPPVITPLRVESDRNDVNLVDGLTHIDLPNLSVPADPRLTFTRVQDVAPYLSGSIPAGDPDTTPSYFSAHTGALTSESFKCLADKCSSVVGSGSTILGKVITKSGSGAVFNFNLSSYDVSTGTGETFIYYASSVQYPDGETITYSYQTSVQGTRTYYRPVTVTSNLGYAISVTYQSDTYSSAWSVPKVATLYATATPATALAQLTYSADVQTITDIGGRIYHCTGCSNGLGGDVETSAGSLQLPGDSGSTKVVTARTDATVVNSVNQDGIAWGYGYTGLVLNPSGTGYNFTKITVTGPDSLADQFNITVTQKRNYITSWVDRLNRTTSYQYDNQNRPTVVINPEGDKTTVVYDIYANITQKTSTAKAGSGLADRVETAYVDTVNCIAVNCYRPVWSRDALNRQTDYVYNSAGQLTEQTDPADSAGVRRKTYTTYGTSTISRPSVVRICGDTTTCGTTAEIRTEYDYLGNTYLPTAMRQIDAAAGVTLTTTYSYDAAGRLLSVDGPLPGTDDTKYFRYDVYGRKTWEIGALAPNGLRLAKRYTYRDSDDKVVLVESGSIPSATSTTLTVFTQTATTYDTRRYPIRNALSSGGTTYQVSDKSFSDRGKQICSATRMNMASLPTDACTLGTAGTQGSDRITKNVYDNADELVQVRKAVGTTLEEAYATYTYTNNGKQQYVIDAVGNRAQMTYDGFDRLSKWTFPSPTLASAYNPSTQANALATAGSLNTADYEQYGYDAANNRVTLRKRDGNTIGYSYDALNRVLVKDIPGGTATDVYYGYDIQGNQLFARFASTSGAGLTNVYDGFGRQTSASNNLDGTARQLTYQYDADGNRTAMTFPDGVQFRYQYDALDRLTYADTSSGVYLAGMGYTDRGTLNYKSLSYNAATYPQYDGINRLSVLGNAFNAGSGSNDVTATYAYNSANQIVTRTQNNDAYAFGGYMSVSRNYATNGLNQYATAGPATFSYDANGNLSGDGSNTYGYDAENRLVSRSGGLALVYDPSGRLWQTSGSTSGTTRYLYDGDQLVAEYDGTGNLLRRYLHGPGDDDPMVWFEGSAISIANKRSLSADERGSIIAVADQNGAPIAVNSYDEYGIPASGNIGRFQYTGQAWLPDLGMYYYKARIYSPTLGRFLQTDPIGYKDQINLYAYVANDPINGSDPSGNATCGSLIPGVVSPSCSGETVLNIMLASQSMNAIGDKFRTGKEAARDARDSTRGRARALNVEAGGRIKQDKNGKYFATSVKDVTTTSIQLPKLESNDRGDWHLHEYSKRDGDGNIVPALTSEGNTFSGDHFSKTDKDGISHDAFLSGVMFGNREYFGYLGAPNGSILQYDPTSKDETVIYPPN